MTPDPGRPVDDATLRALVRDALRDVLPDLLAAVRAAGPRVEDVVVRDDADLAAFAARVLADADDVRAGRLVFRLAGVPGANAAAAVPAPAPSPAPADASASAGGHVVEKGAVTERHVRAAEAAGGRLLLGPRAVLTPLARDRVRASGVRVVRAAAPSSSPPSIPSSSTPSPTPRRH